MIWRVKGKSSAGHSTESTGAICSAGMFLSRKTPACSTSIRKSDLSEVLAVTLMVIANVTS